MNELDSIESKLIWNLEVSVAPGRRLKGKARSSTLAVNMVSVACSFNIERDFSA